MSVREATIESIRQSGWVPVLRAPSADLVPFIMEALLEGGMRTLELTLTIPNAVECIRETVRRFGNDALIGAGTVITPDQAKATIDAGARFLVSPIAETQLTSIAHAAEAPVALGGYTPTEMYRIHESGADFVKLFPADTLGAKYIQAVLAPMPFLRIMPTGGVTVDNAHEFYSAGCPALGIGSALLSKDILAEGDWKELTRRARQLVEVASRRSSI